TADLLANGEFDSKKRQLLSKHLPAINQVVADVDKLLADILQIGYTKQPKANFELKDLTEVIGLAISALKERKPLSAESLLVEYQHTGKALIDPDKIQRVLANLLDNAAESSAAQKKIW